MTRGTFGSGLSEIEIIQNPALGSFLMWRYGTGFQEGRDLPSPVLLGFLVLPLLLHKATFRLVSSTQNRSGLSLFAAKFSEAREDLLAVQARAAVLRPLTLQSLAVGTSTRLLSIDYPAATMRANRLDEDAPAPKVPERLRPLAAAAEKLGHWFAVAGAHQVAATLRVEF